MGSAGCYQCNRFCFFHNYKEILRYPIEFFDNFNDILDSIKEIENEQEKVKEQNKKNNGLIAKFVEDTKPRKLLVINQDNLFEQRIEENNIIKSFVESHKRNDYKFIEDGILLIWINKKY